MLCDSDKKSRLTNCAKIQKACLLNTVVFRLSFFPIPSLFSAIVHTGNIFLHKGNVCHVFSQYSAESWIIYRFWNVLVHTMLSNFFLLLRCWQTLDRLKSSKKTKKTVFNTAPSTQNERWLEITVTENAHFQNATKKLLNKFWISSSKLSTLWRIANRIWNEISPNRRWYSQCSTTTKLSSISVNTPYCYLWRGKERSIGIKTLELFFQCMWKMMATHSLIQCLFISLV